MQTQAVHVHAQQGPFKAETAAAIVWNDRGVKLLLLPAGSMTKPPHFCVIKSLFCFFRPLLYHCFGAASTPAAKFFHFFTKSKSAR